MEASETVAPDENVVVGDEGHDVAKDAQEQQPIGEDPGGRGTVSQRSALDPSTQSGVPLNEDKADGVQAGEVPEPPGAPEVAETP